MKYLIVGAGGTGGCIGAYLTRAGKDVSFIARGAHLEAMQQQGLEIRGGCFGGFRLPVKAFSSEQYTETPDVIFLCVKAYSLASAAETIKAHASKETVIVPILNGLDIEEQLTALLPGYRIIKSFMYITAARTGPGLVENKGDFFRVILRHESAHIPKEIAEEIVQDLKDAGIDASVSDDIDRDVYKKFMFISPLAATQCSFHANVGEIRENEEMLSFYLSLAEELGAIAEKQGVRLNWDAREQAMKEIEKRPASMLASAYLDVKNGRQAETDGLIMAPIRLGEQVGVETPTYRRAAACLQQQQN